MGLSLQGDQAVRVLDSLASPVRLAAWRELVRAGLDGMVAGELATALAVAPNTLSFHLKAMLGADLLSVAQEGRFLRYRANIPLMLGLIGYLTDECCAGHPEACKALRRDANCAPDLLPPCGNPE